MELQCPRGGCDRAAQDGCWGSMLVILESSVGEEGISAGEGGHWQQEVGYKQRID